MSQQSNPDDAVNVLLPAGVSPAALIEMGDDPDNASAYARMVWYEQNVVMRQNSSTLTANQRLEWIKALQKVGRLEQAPPQNPSGDGVRLPMIQIILPNSGQNLELELKRDNVIDITPEGVNE